MKALLVVLANIVALMECAYSQQVAPVEFQFGGVL